MTRHPGCLLKETDLDAKEFMDLVGLAVQLKAEKANGRELPRLTGKNIALIFEKASTRTRCAFEVAAFDQGAHVTYLGPDGSHIGSKESIADTARVLGRMYDAIEFRGFSQAAVEKLADESGVPVWNGLTDEWHPTQMLADVMTMIEHSPGKELKDITVAYLGDGRNNVARSLLVTGALLGMDVRIATPHELRPPQTVIDIATGLAADSGGHTLVTGDVLAAVRGVDFVYTDVWVSMGEPADEWARRVAHLRPYRVTAEIMAATGTPGVKFLHCLPSIHNAETAAGSHALEEFGLNGVEVTEDVFESPSSIVFDQAENRLHTIKAVMVAGLAG